MILCDGSSLLHRCLNTVQSELKDSKGRATGGVHSFLISIGALIHRRRFRDAIIVCWDSGVPLFRRDIYRNYKPQKSAVGDVGLQYKSDMHLLKQVDEDAESTSDFLDQYQMSRRMLHNFFLPNLGCMSIQVPNCEADDIIAYCARGLSGVEDVTILSSDRDLIQLLTDTVTYYDGRVNEFWHIEDVIEKYGLVEDCWRHQWLLGRAIAGDSSDGIPGVGGIGLDAALAYARQIVTAKDSTLEEALKGLQRGPRGKQTAYENLKVSENIIQRNYDLMNLDYPMVKKLPIINEIKAGLSLSYTCCRSDIDSVMSELHDMNMNRAKLYAEHIIESTDQHNPLHLIEKLQGV